jgi:hypothetical protein
MCVWKLLSIKIGRFKRNFKAAQRLRSCLLHNLTAKIKRIVYKSERRARIGIDKNRHIQQNNTFNLLRRSNIDWIYQLYLRIYFKSIIN